MDYAVPSPGTLNSWSLIVETFNQEDPVIFEDVFSSKSIDKKKWVLVEGGTVENMDPYTNNPNYSLRLNGCPFGGDTVETKALDLSCPCYLGAKLTYEYERTGSIPCGNSTEDGEDLIIEYYNGSDWVELDRQPGSGKDMTSFKQVTKTLPSDALHESFKVRFRNIGTLGLTCWAVYDDWFVDNVKVEANKFEISGVITTPNFEGSSMLGWTTNQTFCGPVWHSNGSQSARIFTLNKTHEADTWLGLSQNIDLSGICAIKFDATTAASSGGTWEKCKACVCIDDTEVWSDTGEDKTWTDVLIDTSEYNGEHTLSLRLCFIETDTFDEDLQFDNLRTYSSE